MHPSVPDADNLTPLPKRVADQEVDGELAGADPVEFVEQLLERAALLLATLEADVEGLEADQRDERVLIEQQWQREQEAVDRTTDRLARMRSDALEIAAHKARLAEIERALNPAATPPVPDTMTVEEIDQRLVVLTRELRAAKGITGAIRLPQIAILLNEAESALTGLARVAEQTRQDLVSRTEDELNAEGKEARASFEIGLSVLQRDLEVLERALPVGARSWTDPAWADWSAPTAPSGWVRFGVVSHPRLPAAPVPVLMPVTGNPGLIIEGGPHRDLAVDGLRSLVLRLLASVPPGRLQLSFVDAQAMGETASPFLALADFDSSIVGDRAFVLEDEIEAHLERLTRQIERISTQCLQGRHATLDAYHEDIGEVVEPYRYLVVIDHPTGLSERGSNLLRGIIEAGPRCGVTTIVLRTPKTRSAVRATTALPALPTIRSTADGLTFEMPRSGKWLVRPDDPPVLAPGSAGLSDRILTATGLGAREALRAPVTLSSVLGLVAEAARRHARSDLPLGGVAVELDRDETWWSGDASEGVGAPIGRTDGRRPISPWFDESHAGVVVTGPRRAGVSSLLATFIDALALEYPPEECQLLLVGLGDRLAFAPFGEDGLPHARLVAVEAERELGLSVLEACVAIVERRQLRLEVSGTERFGLSGHRQRTGERLPRLVLAIDGVSELFVADDTTADRARQLLATLAADGPSRGVHLLLADRLDGDQAAALVDRLPDRLGMHVQVGPERGGEAEVAAADGRGAGPADGATIAMIGARRATTETRFRFARTPDHERAAIVRTLSRRAIDNGFNGRPQVVRGDRGADLALAPLAQLAGDPGRRSERRSARVWLGEPVGLGAPIEVLFRRQEGANLAIVTRDPALGQGALFAALTTAALVHDRSLEAWIVDFLPLDAGFGGRFLGLADRAVIHVGRRRNLTKSLDTVHRVVQDRLVHGRTDDPPRLLVVNGFGRAHDFDAAAGAPTTPMRLDPVGVLTAILRDGPEVGVHTLLWCDTLELLHRRLGPDALAEFGLRLGGEMSAEESMALLDSSYAATLRPQHALLYDEDHGRLVKLRPYALPPDGWAPPA